MFGQVAFRRYERGGGNCYLIAEMFSCECSTVDGGTRGEQDCAAGENES